MLCNSVAFFLKYFAGGVYISLGFFCAVDLGVSSELASQPLYPEE